MLKSRRDIRVPASRKTARALVVSLIVGLPLAGCLGYDGDVQHGYIADQQSLEQVKVGSSAEQVLVLLGTPSTTSTVGGDAWYYISQKTERKLAFYADTITDRRIVAVYFGKTKKVDRIANYGLEDGRVVDAVSRTTPTGGAESSFISSLFRNLLRFS